MTLLVSHGDADGVVSAALVLMKQRKCFIRFSAVGKLRQVLCSLIAKSNLKQELWILDLSPNEVTLKLASLFKHVTWIDHHKVSVAEVPPNIELILDSSSPSAAQLVASYLGIESDLVVLANEVDTNSVKSDDAAFLRDYIGMLKHKHRGLELNRKLVSLTRYLASGKLEDLMNKESIIEEVQAYRKRVKEYTKKSIERLRIEQLGDLKLAIVEKTTPFVPIYAICTELQEHAEAPFDLLVFALPIVSRNNIRTKLEFRTHTELDVNEIARKLGGGGHEKASGAMLDGFYTGDKLIELLKSHLSEKTTSST